MNQIHLVDVKKKKKKKKKKAGLQVGAAGKHGSKIKAKYYVESV